MSLNIGQIPPLTTELADLERLKIDVTTFSRLLLIRSFLNLQVMRTYMISWISSKFDQIKPSTMQLAALDRRQVIPIYRLIIEGTSSSHFSTVFDSILFILACNENIHKSLDEFEFRPDPTTGYGVSCP